MKKKIIIVAAISALSLVACQSGQGSKSEATEPQQETDVKECAAEVSLKDIIDFGDKYIDKHVNFTGKVLGVCHHSGKKMFLRDLSDSTVTIRMIAAPGERFDTAMIGSTAKVESIVRVNKTSKSEISEQLQKLDESVEKKSADNDKETGHKHCRGKINKEKLEKMLEWITANNKDSFPEYYVECVNINTIEKASNNEKPACCQGK